MSSRKLRIGVIGAGHLGAIHARLLRSIDDVQLVGIADPCEEARQRVAAETQATPFPDHRALLGQIDAAIIAAPTEHHYWLGQELAEAGVHLFVEKPLASTVAEADALLRAVQSRQLVLQVGHVERFNPAFTAAAGLIHKPRYIEAVRAGTFTGRSVDVGVVLDLMIHDLDLVLTLVRSEVLEVEASGAVVFGPHEDLAEARLRFANGCVAHLKAARVAYQAQRHMEVFSHRAFVHIDFAAGAATIVRPSERVLRGEIDVRHLAPAERQTFQQKLFTELLPVEHVQVEKRNAILDEQHDFVISIRTGQKPNVTGWQGRQAIAVAQRILAKLADQPRTLARPGLPPAPDWDGEHQADDERRRKAG